MLDVPTRIPRPWRMSRAVWSSARSHVKKARSVRMPSVRNRTSARLPSSVRFFTLREVYIANRSGETAGPSRLLCKYQNCSNPACAFRHEDANGNPIPPPALTAAKTAKDAASARSASAAAAIAANPSSDNEDGDFEVVMSSRGLMDGALEDKGGAGAEKQCRYGERCTRCMSSLLLSE